MVFQWDFFRWFGTYPPAVSSNMAGAQGIPSLNFLVKLPQMTSHVQGGAQGRER